MKDSVCPPFNQTHNPTMPETTEEKPRDLPQHANDRKRSGKYFISWRDPARIHPALKPWYKFIQVGGVVYTVIWSILLYFGWKDSPEWITWCDLVTGLVLLHLAYQLYQEVDITRNRKLIRLIHFVSLLYATTWTLIVMFVFGVELLLPLDIISLCVTIGLMRSLWRSRIHAFEAAASW